MGSATVFQNDLNNLGEVGVAMTVVSSECIRVKVGCVGAGGSGVSLVSIGLVTPADSPGSPGMAQTVRTVWPR